MQSATDLLLSLNRRGIKLWTENDAVRFQAPAGSLCPDDLVKLRELKYEIMKLLALRMLEADPPLQRRPAGCTVPLTATQSRRWNWLIQHEGGLSERLCSVAMRVTGSLDIAALQRSLEALVARHESLRTRIVETKGISHQEIYPVGEFPLEVVDLSKLSPDMADQKARYLGETFIHEKIDPSTGPLFAAKLYSLPGDQHVLVFAIEHLVTDGISNSILSREVWALYREAINGREILLPEIPLQFADYAFWQKQTFQAWRDRHEPYWRERLADSPRTRLPIDHAKATLGNPSYTVSQHSFGGELTAKLRKLAKDEKTLLALVVLTIYVTAASQWCRTSDLVVKFVSSGRHRRELHDVVGSLACHLHLRIKLFEGDSFVDLLKRINFAFLSAYAHQDFDRVPDLFPECDTELYFNWLPTDPMSNWVVTNWARTSKPCKTDYGLTIEPFSFEVRWPGTFSPMFSDTGDDVRLTLVFRRDLFSRRTPERFCRTMTSLAREFSKWPHASLKR